MSTYYVDLYPTITSSYPLSLKPSSFPLASPILCSQTVLHHCMQRRQGRQEEISAEICRFDAYTM